MGELKEGTELNRVIGQVDRDGGGPVWATEEPFGYATICTRIIVSMQNGQMDGVPWARCERKDGTVDLVNLATVESVALA